METTAPTSTIEEARESVCFANPDSAEWQDARDLLDSKD